ncbi:hypothetical protein [Marivirga harenae]|uniref:hypothetical protein n=1 Tax=Marivirga harenae TaxID=2010992 RepID=UPI0026DF2AF5|nr:hypothetical protein [Marivirga harenae]WKV10530.1 hypothetical protein Q3Y49_09925 [Marivirga harenae]|tara:strand:- start:487127 stop:487609 length:483 start_codon:yes stop_codon:yes gene_type:complete
MKTQFLILAITILSMSCKEDNITNDRIEIDMYFSLVDQNGNDLLDPNNANHIKESDIKLTYFMDSSLQNPESSKELRFLNEKKDGLYMLSLVPNHTDNYEKPITHVEWGDFKKDTLKASVARSQGILAFAKVWLNNELIYDPSDRELEDGYYNIIQLNIE